MRKKPPHTPHIHPAIILYEKMKLVSGLNTLLLRFQVVTFVSVT